MKTSYAVIELNAWTQAKRWLFTSEDLAKVFGESGPTLRATITRLANSGIIRRVARNLYETRIGSQPTEYAIEHIACALRRGDYVFESLESAASQWGVISQIPLGRITVMTTGRGGVFDTPYGTIEFVHTDASPAEIRANTVERPGNPLPIATKRYTVHNLLRCNRSTYLIDWEELEDDDD